MRTLDAELIERIKSMTDFTEKAVITFGDGTTETLYADRFSVNNNSFTYGAFATDFPIGYAVSGELLVELYNGDGYFNGYEFYGATIELYLQLKRANGTYFNDIHIGTFFVNTPQGIGDVVSITAYDSMSLTGKPFSTELVFPITLGALFSEVVRVGLGSAYIGRTNFTNSGLYVDGVPEDISCRELLGYISMLAGGNAVIDKYGKVQIVEYDLAKCSEGNTDITVDKWVNVTIETNDVFFTGISATITDEDGNEQEVSVVGNDLSDEEYDNSYVMALENPLLSMLYDMSGTMSKTELATYAIGQISEKFIGHRFRIFDGTVIANPAHEFMDTVELVDIKGNRYYSVFTDVIFNVGGQTQLKNTAASYVFTTNAYSNPYSKTLSDAKNLIAKDRTAWESAVDRLDEMLNNTTGLHVETVKGQNGSVLAVLLKDNPNTPKNVIKITTSGIGFSVNGGESYFYGISTDGSVVAESVNAVSIDAETIRVKNDDGGTSTLMTVLNGSIQSAVTSGIDGQLGAGTKYAQDAEKFEQLFGQDGNYTKYIRFTENGIDIGAEEDGGTVKCVIEKNRVAFYQSGVLMGYFSDNELHTTVATAESRIIVGVSDDEAGYHPFSWNFSRTTGHFSLRMVK